MQIEIKQSKVNQDGLWWVVATLPSGLAHDSFQTEAQALDFARCFYGVDLTPHTKTAPNTTWSKVVDYNTTANHCTCPDFAHRGGSYTVNGQRVCKHIKHVQDTHQAIRITLK